MALIQITSMPLRYALTALLVTAIAPAETLQDVKDRIDKSAASFKSLTAKVQKLTYTAVIRDTVTESGTLAVKKVKNGEIRVRMEITNPDRRSISLSSKKYEVFLPKINTVQEYDLRRYDKLVDQFLLLGFGTKSADLDKSYNMKLIGTETVNGQETSHLLLTPKDAKALEHIKLVEFWIPLNDGNAIQQKFLQPSGDYFLSSYADAKVNGQLTDEETNLKLPK